ncbi:MAG: THUMP-like domain-containing protein [Cytophaga sp.]|uniref:THUMP-like domain-containing protein n=1 Tax=Cytophaga sp. TaxID=29535 RepID=UPI003F7F21C6
MVPIEELTSKEISEFIKKNRKSSVAELMLKMPQFTIEAKWIAAQIEGWQKAFVKLPEWAGNERVIYPIRLSMEQCSSERTGLYKSTLVHGSVIVDLTGGFGVDTFYLSQSFAKSFYIEQQEDLAQIAAHNFAVLGKNISVLTGNSEVVLKTITDKIDVIYLDPARRKDQQKVFKLSDCEPDIAALKDFYFSFAGIILVKTSPMLDIAEATRQLANISEIHIVSVDNECKEVLYLLKKDYTGEPEIRCINAIKKSVQSFQFKNSIEQSYKAPQSMPLRYIYEPNPSVLKAGGFNVIAQAYNIFKLHQSSHLYTSAELITDFPGRSFKINHITGYDKKAIQTLLPDGKANIQTRNFPDSVEEIRKKIKVKDGGSIFIFATTLMDSTKALLICEKI